MILYHYTCVEHLPRIFLNGFLKVTESNISYKKAHAGPDVVWLTTDDSLKHGHGLDGTWDKRRLRFSVKIPDEEAIEWEPWADFLGMSPIWKAAMKKSARGGSETWYVVTRPIPQNEWIEIRDMKTEGTIWNQASAGLIRLDGFRRN